MLNKKKISLFIMSMFICTFFFVQTPLTFADDQGILSKIQNFTSMQSESNINIKISASNLSKSEEETFSKLLPYISNMNFKVTSKLNILNGNSVGFYIKLSTSLLWIPLNIEFWAKSEILDDKQHTIVILKMPSVAGIKLLNGKDYAVSDEYEPLDKDNEKIDDNKESDDLNDVNKLLNKLMLAITPYALEMQSKFNIFSDNGDIKVTTPGGIEAAHQYEIKFSDSTLKDTVRYIVDNLLGNKDFVNEIEKIIAEADPDYKSDETGEDMQKSIKGIDEVLDSFKNIKFIDDKGVDIKYALNNDGFLDNIDGSINVVIDTQKLEKVLNQFDDSSSKSETSRNGSEAVLKIPSSEEAPTGVYKIAVDFTSVYFNINKDVKIDYPEITSDNSTKFDDLLESIPPDENILNDDTKKPDSSKINKEDKKPSSITKKPAIKTNKSSVSTKKTLSNTNKAGASLKKPQTIAKKTSASQKKSSTKSNKSKVVKKSKKK